MTSINRRYAITVKAAIVAFFAFLLGACSNPLSFSVDHSDKTDFSLFKTYRWYDDIHGSKEADYRQYNSSDKRVRTHVDAQLKSKGFMESTSKSADFWMNYHISKEDHMKIDNFGGYSQGMHGSVGAGTYGSAVSIGYSSGPSVRTYREGTVVLDVIDSQSNKIVWRGIAEGRLDKSNSHNDKNRIAKEVSQELLADFPPGTGATP